MLSLSHVQLFVTPPWTVAHQAPLSMGFSRQEYWSGLPVPSPELLIYFGYLPFPCDVSLLFFAFAFKDFFVMQAFFFKRKSFLWRSEILIQCKISYKDEHYSIALGGKPWTKIWQPLLKLTAQQNFLLPFYIYWFIYSKIFIEFLICAGVFPGGSEVKNSPANAGDADLIPVLGRSLGEGNGNPLHYSCLGNPMDRGAWQATVHSVAESDTT